MLYRGRAYGRVEWGGDLGRARSITELLDLAPLTPPPYPRSFYGDIALSMLGFAGFMAWVILALRSDPRRQALLPVALQPPKEKT